LGRLVKMKTKGKAFPKYSRPRLKLSRPRTFEESTVEAKAKMSRLSRHSAEDLQSK